jgi:hypothetical protein
MYVQTNMLKHRLNLMPPMPRGGGKKNKGI